MLNLVDPSLFCYINQVTQILNDKNQVINIENTLEHIGEGETVDFYNGLTSPKWKRSSTTYAKSDTYQRRAGPFQLQDPTQIGHRKMLIFYLVDPSCRILSTANIPPQQTHWLINLVRSMSPFNQLPSVVFDKIMNYIKFLMSMKEAKLYREKLLVERNLFTCRSNELLFEKRFKDHSYDDD